MRFSWIVFDRIPLDFFLFRIMNQPKNHKTCASDESFCSLLVGFNFIFFTGLLAFMLFLPLQAVLFGSDAPHGTVASHEGVADASHDTTAEVSDAAAVVEVIAPAAGKAAYMVCSTCHGAEGEGNAALNAPALAGQQDWYLKRQLIKYKEGVRGTHPDDIYGMQMRPMAMMLTDAKIDEVVGYIAQLPAAAPLPTLGGDVAKGAASYAVCAACHGPDAEGNELLKAPSLQNLPDWYIVRQLQNYKSGVRGTHPKDIEGMQMRPMAMMLADDQVMNDIAAFINSKAAAK
jgi:cytochrome c553